MLCFIEIFDETIFDEIIFDEIKETMPILKPWAGSFLT
jgi:hypothetical protein